MTSHKAIVQAGEALELTAGWTELEQAEPGALFLIAVRHKRIGLGRHYLVPVGKPVGGLATEIKLARLPRQRKTG